MEFFETFNSTWELIGPNVRKIAETTSSYPDIPVEVWTKQGFPRNAREAISLLLILPMVIPSTRNHFLISQIREHVDNMAYRYRYQGKWSVVSEVIQNADQSSSVVETWDILLPYFNENDWYGNMVPLMMKALSSLRWRKIYSSVTEDSLVIQPIRKRGYDDKGALRPSHKWLPSEYQIEIKEIERNPRKQPQPFRWFERFGKGSG